MTGRPSRAACMAAAPAAAAPAGAKERRVHGCGMQRLDFSLQLHARQHQLPWASHPRTGRWSSCPAAATAATARRLAAGRRWAPARPFTEPCSRCWRRMPPSLQPWACRAFCISLGPNYAVRALCRRSRAATSQELAAGACGRQPHARGRRSRAGLAPSLSLPLRLEELMCARQALRRLQA